MKNLITLQYKIIYSTTFLTRDSATASLNASKKS